MDKTWLVARIRADTGKTAVLPVLSELLSIDRVTVCKKMRGNSQFTPSEIDRIRVRFELTDQEVVEHFIRQKGAQT